MNDRADSANLAPEERLRQASAILAAGVLRLRQRAALPGKPTGNPAKSPATGLEVPAETVLSVHTG